MPEAARILIVDDEALNLEILTEVLEEAGHTVTTARDGQLAWETIERSAEVFDVVLLDRMMPRLDGIEVLKRIKAHPTHALTPVVLQTACAAPEDLRVGLESGAFSYLAKPFDEVTLKAVVQAAIVEHRRFREVRAEAARVARASIMLERGCFAFRTLDEARDLAALLAGVTPDGPRVSVGLHELLLNAIEHGNLGITYDEKSKLNEMGEWEREVERRLELPENRRKRAEVEFVRERDELHFRIRDCGPGFDWRRYLDMDSSRAFDNHGRGIAMAKLVSFDDVHFLGSGNEVEATLRVAAPCSDAAGAGPDSPPGDTSSADVRPEPPAALPSEPNLIHHAAGDRGADSPSPSAALPGAPRVERELHRGS